ncbi:MAG: hypothetical protein EYC62_05785 [Alphaproteobacteria bacterium]|nr:MAG: hypothetical protein EYC62_05785 [Alphaproteobacteria bacterium]
MKKYLKIIGDVAGVVALILAAFYIIDIQSILRDQGIEEDFIYNFWIICRYAALFVVAGIPISLGIASIWQLADRWDVRHKVTKPTNTGILFKRKVWTIFSIGCCAYLILFGPFI